MSSGTRTDGAVGEQGVGASSAQSDLKDEVVVPSLSDEECALVSRVYVEFDLWMQSMGMTCPNAFWFGLLLGRASGMIPDAVLPNTPPSPLVDRGVLRLSALLHQYLPGLRAFQVMKVLYSLVSKAK
ncbi:hypothetical protein KBD61_03450 [Patescibacteria group bacterium]|nr:hypothetical protein [Patescibacteria group bacterium]MBP9710052.1 hypothetical protein [Patescibacteria group bacterium]